jgi:hypothetical protein
LLTWRSFERSRGARLLAIVFLSLGFGGSIAQIAHSWLAGVVVGGGAVVMLVMGMILGKEARKR